MTVGSWGGLPRSAGLTFCGTLAGQWRSGSLSPEAQRAARMQSVCKSKMGNDEKGEREMNGHGTGFCE